MNEALARAAWAGLLRLGLPLYFARLWWRGRREPPYRAHWAERLGRSSAPAAPGSVWIHAVSLGETLAARPLVEALRAQQPGLRLLLTHGTATGREAGRALLREGDAQAWLPVDTPGAVRRFLAQQRPAVGVLMETEVWPALLHACRNAGLPVLLANARLSERSLRKGRRLRALLQPAVASFTRVLAQTEDDAQRLLAAGASPAAVAVAGNLKFDLAPAPALLQQGAAWRAQLHAQQRRVLLLASAREGEEAELLALWHSHLQQAGAGAAGWRPLLLIVPRHPQRFDEVAALLAGAGLRCLRRSQWQQTLPEEALQADAWLGDSLGEMALYYAAADAALLGGSFAPLGGHNLIEAAACGCPLVMGPSTFNFAQAAERAVQAGAACQTTAMPEALQQALALCGDRAGREAMAARAQAFAARHRGAAARMAQEVLALLPRPL